MPCFKLSSSDYQKELDFVVEHNPVELGLYFIIECLLRSVINENLTVCNVSTYRRTKEKIHKYASQARVFLT